MTPEETQELTAYIQQCDPNRPLRGAADPLYVPLDQGEPVRGSDSTAIIHQLSKTIRLVSDPIAKPTCQLFTGFQGTGKTTELNRLKEELEQDKFTPTHVVFINFEQYIDIYTPITITDVLRVLAYALDHEASREEAIAAKKDPDKISPTYLRRFFDFVSSFDAELKEIGFESYGAQLMLEIKDNPNFRRKIENTLNLRFQQFAAEAKSVMDEAITRLRKTTHALRIVVIADGLEKLTYLRDEERENIETSTEALFVTHASLLRLSVHAIYTFPFWLRFAATELGALYDGEPRVLPMVKIHDERNRAFQSGLDKLEQLIGKRLPLERVFGQTPEQRLETLQPILQASGGYPRDLLRMVRDALYDTPAFPVPHHVCKRAIDRLRQTYERALRTPDLELLLEVARTHRLPKGDGSRLASFTRLFSQHFVLAYLNGDEWYDLHPLIRRARDVKEALNKSNS